MNIQRFTAPTAREALAQARQAFGESTLILSNRATANGVEVVATGEDTLAELDRNALAQGNGGGGRSSGRGSAPRGSAPLPQRADPNSAVLDDTTQMAMSTLSFQDYVRERMLRRRQEALQAAPATAAAAQPAESAPNRVAARANSHGSAPVFDGANDLVAPPAAPPVGQPAWSAAPVPPAPPRPAAAPPARRPAPSLHAEPAAAHPSVMQELQAMKNLIEERFNTLTWLGQTRQSPLHSNLMLKLIRSGYSPALARTLLERLPEDSSAAEAMKWVMDVLTRNVRTDAGQSAMHEHGGVFALVGSTGVGKTTTAAKLAGLCARAHGAASVGLITLDTYRVGAHEQLRAYGRMLGVVAHLAHDRAALQDLLGLLANKKMVLIDTTGVAPHDPRKRDLLDVLDLPGVNRLMVVNAGSHGDTLDDTIGAFKTGQQQAILSKVDEAAKLGPALDSVIRHQLVLRGVTMGQRVPEDFDRADATRLVAQSMRAPSRSAFDPAATDLNFFFAQSQALPLEQFHA